MIIKLQVSVLSATGRRRILAYDEKRTFSFEGDLDPDTELLMGGRLKAFFYARIDPTARLLIEGGAPWQSW